MTEQCHVYVSAWQCTSAWQYTYARFLSAISERMLSDSLTKLANEMNTLKPSHNAPLHSTLFKHAEGIQAT